MFKRLCLTVFALIAVSAPGVAYAQEQSPSISGNAWVAIAIIVGLVVLIMLFISGAISLSRRDRPDDDGGVGILEGIDEDDDEPKRR